MVLSQRLSTEISRLYVRTQCLPEGYARVLFEIFVPPNKSCAAHAYIGNISFHHEEGVLFSIGTIFVVDIVEDPQKSLGEEKNYYTLHVTTSDIDKMRAKI
ncbi:unnamed protein product [Adineta ricciae]|uniref:Uncharacterized protein n=1 Tax=Adineta ricciae TaxID=249248 RepID=A0A814JBQ3_ADIRI|nr:unnamed protein product [Adineta ricciae]